MKPPTSRREGIADANREAVLLAIARLGRARSGEILDYINEELHKAISKRAVQDWISKLEEKGYVNRNKYDMCYLSERGKDLRLFADTCGKTNFEHLFSIPLPGRTEEDLEEIIRRFGFLIVWHFMFVVLPEAWRKDEPEEDAFILRWAQDSIPVASMFDIFMKKFGSKTKSKFYAHMINENVRNKLFSILYKNHPQAFAAMLASWNEMMTEILKEQQDDQKKALEEIGRLFNEKEKDDRAV